MVTAGGLIFTGTRDGKVRALDVANGKVLWEYELDAALEGMPAVYEVSGREYVVFCAAAQAGLTPGNSGEHPWRLCGIRTAGSLRFCQGYRHTPRSVSVATAQAHHQHGAPV